MDRVTLSAHRVSMSSQPAQVQQERPEPASPRPQVRDVVPSSSTTPAGIPAANSHIDPEKVGKNACAGAVGVGVVYGIAAAANNAVRTASGLPKAAKVAAALLPSASVYLTPWVEDGMRHALGTTQTYPNRPSLAHDAVASGGLFLFNLGWTCSAMIPRFPATTPAGMASMVIQCTLASTFAGGASELSAQWMNRRDHEAGEPLRMPADIDNTRKGTGRLYSQAPAACVHVCLALRGKPLPAHLALLPSAFVSGGWTFRRELIPPAAPVHTEPVLAPAHAPVDPKAPPEPVTIPPA